MTVPVLPSRLAGCRVIRALGSGPSAELFLVQGDEGAQLVVKRYAASVPRPEVDRELTALARTEHAHVVRLLDAETDEDGRVLAVLARAPNGSLAHWLEARDRVGAGEAVTVIAPLADAVRTLHSVGVAHGRLTTSRVLFDASGAPVIVGFGGAAIFEPGSPPALRERIPEAVADLDALRAIAALVLGRVGRSSGIDEVVALAQHVPASQLCALLADELFEHAAGSPVRFDTPMDTAVLTDSARTPTSDGTVLRVAELFDRGARGLVRDAVRVAWKRVDPGRRRLVVGVAAAGITALTAVLLVPGTPSSSRAEQRDGPSRSASAARTSSPAADEPAVTGDDPVAAFAVLARTRERCLRDQDAMCIGAVDESGSAAELADTAAISGSDDPIAVSPDRCALVQLLGAAALIESGSPAVRTLVVRTASGWRIRDLPGIAEDG